MTKLTMPSDIGRRLAATRDCVEVCDEVGRTIGFFTPVVAGTPRGPLVSDEELERRDRDEPTFSTDEVITHLRTL